ncbi:hypothetical protein ACIBF6_41960 [Streptosporangium amethystogenes]|uniref:hypothetical protein n=1 Tax=Streptosporangium amethystogenes TaxID=2002 RepID=UPI0037A43969
MSLGSRVRNSSPSVAAEVQATSSTSLAEEELSGQLETLDRLEIERRPISPEINRDPGDIRL